MKILNFKGCPLDSIGCYGPREQWYLFEVPTKLYPKLIIIALIISAIVFSFLHMINKKTKKNLIIALIVFFIILILEIIFMYYIETNMVYSFINLLSCF